VIESSVVASALAAYPALLLPLRPAYCEQEKHPSVAAQQNPVSFGDIHHQGGRNAEAAAF
jgi:hypothetical protein